MGVLLGIYLSRTGFSATDVGLVIAAGMAGGALATMLASFRADRLGRRRTLVALAAFSSVGGLGLSATAEGSWLLALAFLGMLNGMGRDRGAAYAVDQAILSGLVSPDRRTWALSFYTVVLAAGQAVGALASAVPALLHERLHADWLYSYRAAFGLFIFLNLLSAALCYFLSPQVEIRRDAFPGGSGGPKLSPASKEIVAKLAALSALDSLGGGFLTNALLAYWFLHRFGISEASLGPLFFGFHLLNSGSYLVAAWLARRIGLVNTMVFTHIPSSLLLIAVPFAPSFPWAVVLFLARECLVEMDVPTRQSYIVAVVEPQERTFATGVTTLTRNVSWAAGPSLAGYLMQHVALSTPLFLGGGIKIVYDLLLYAAFRRLKPPEEQPASPPASRGPAAAHPLSGGK